MPSRKTLYLLRRPIADSMQTLWPSTSSASSSDKLSLLLLEEALSSSPTFPGQIYVLHPRSDVPVGSVSGQLISYKDLVTLIDEHEVTIVL
ncbi:MAG: hypothetical protein OJF47_002959 [Nitrospira sp.]|jgi:hypothetical protein|nr:MAG: hypothetical protein OJF47_002959 [Nitrospira sp.]